MPEEFNIDDVVALDPADTTAFTPEHKTFLEEHKDELTTDELAKFGFEVEAPKPVGRNTPEPAVTPDPEPKKDKKEDDEDDDDDSKTDQKIGRAVEQAVSPFRKQNQDLQDKVEVDTFVASNPDFAKYKGAIMEHIKDPAYARVPVDRIAKMIAADDLMKIGARREREAQKNANSTRNPGNSARQPAGAAKDWGSESKEAFEAKRAEVLGRS